MSEIDPRDIIRIHVDTETFRRARVGCAKVARMGERGATLVSQREVWAMAAVIWNLVGPDEDEMAKGAAATPAGHTPISEI